MSPDLSLDLHDLSVARGGRTILSGLTASIRPGEVCVLLGPNGAGKSSLIEVMAGLRQPSAGAVLLDGRPLSDMPARERARRIGYLPQGGEVHWNLRVRDLVALGRAPHLGPFARLSVTDHAAIEQALEQADAAALADRLVLGLSGGERARVLLARLLAGEPQLILADEPLANLDPRHQLQSLALFRAAADAGAAVVLVVHDLSAAARAADRLMLLAGGRLLGEGPPRDVLTPGLIREAYGIDAVIRDDPETGLLVLPVG